MYYRNHALQLCSGLFFLAIIISGCRDQGGQDAIPTAQPAAGPAFPRPAKPHPPSKDFVGSATCMQCHTEICDAFHGHPMGRSTAKTSDPPIEDYLENVRFKLPPSPHTSARTSYYVEKKDGEVRHHEVLEDSEGAEIYDVSVPVQYAIGSGRRGRSYITDRGGIMFMSPITWYSEAQRWDLSPGYQHNNLHFGRRIVDGCLSCHVGQVSPAEGLADQYLAKPFPEESIGCERCHGPGQNHVKFHSGDSPDQKDEIVNPAKLPPVERDHVCFQCHLIGEHRLLRYGRTEFDFRPGDDLADIWTILVKDASVDSESKTEVVSQVEQMLGSTCYQQSEGALGCISCHDPHQLPAADQRVEFFRSSCLKCHGPEQTECNVPVAQRLETSAEDSCIACHMPQIKANDVPHTSQTDHRILRKPMQRQRASTAKPGLAIFEVDSGKLTSDEIDRAGAISLIRSAEQTGNALLAADAIPILERWLSVVTDDHHASVTLGIAYYLLEDHRLAQKTWEAALETAPQDEYILRRLLVLCHETEQLEKGVEYGERLVAINPWDYEYHGRLAHMLAAINRTEDGIRHAQEALKLNPAEIRIHNWLSDLYESQGKKEESQHHRKQVERMSK